MYLTDISIILECVAGDGIIVIFYYLSSI